VERVNGDFLIITVWRLFIMDFNFGRKILQRKSKIKLAFPAKVKVQQNVEMFIYKLYYHLDTTVLLKAIHTIEILKPIDVVSNVNDS
jgi:hypothetical protein